MSLPAAFLNPPGSSGVNKIVTGAVGLAPLMLGVFIRTINEGEYGFRTRFGKAIQCRRDRTLKDGTKLQKGDVIPLAPGTYFAFPVIFSIRIIDVKIQAIDLPGRPMETADGTQRFIEASIEYRRGSTGKDLRRSELGVTNELEVMANHVAGVLRDTVSSHQGGDENPPNSENISPVVVETCKQDVLEKCGIELLKVHITGNSLTPAEMQRRMMREFARSITGGQESQEPLHAPGHRHPVLVPFPGLTSTQM